MKSTSPFSLDRFEYESRHLYYLQKELFDRLEEPKPVYLVGSRGTGKTTLLQALNWAERRANPTLIQKIAEEPARRKYVGIYLKLPEIQFDVLRRWLDSYQDAYPIIFAFFLDLIWLEALLDALAELIVIETFDVSADAEQACVAQIVNEFQNTFGSTVGKPSTLKELSKAIRDIRETLEMLSRRKEDPADAIARFRIVGQVGDFGRKVGAFLHRLCVIPGKPETSYTDWHFKICMDEGECLDEFQQRVINTMFRISRAPVFLVISYVRMPSDASTTLIDNLTLQIADRDLILLDEMSEKEFREMAEGVATIRVRALLGNNETTFNLQNSLGVLDVNKLLHGILTTSVSSVAKKLLESAEALAGQRRSSKSHKESLPICEAYLDDKLNLPNIASDSEKWRKRKDSSAGIRKKFVAAYLSICAEIKSDVQYAFAEMVLQMSDMCIRDFLHQLDAIYTEAGWDLERFISSKVPIKIQDTALKKASNDKFISIPKSGVNEPRKVSSVINGLARLTTNLQTRSDNCSHLRSSERGQFLVSMEKKPAEGGEIMYQTIKDAAEAGFIKLIRQDSQELCFRVHTSLAAHYGFSYRGAYYQTSLDWDDLIKLKNTESDKESLDVILSIANKLQGGTLPASLSLFDAIYDE